MKQLMKRTIALAILFLFIWLTPTAAEEQRIYDQAELLTNEQIQDLEAQASAYFEEWQTDFIIITTDGLDGKDLIVYMDDFTDDLAEQFNRAEDNMAVLMMDMETKEINLAGYGRAEDLLDNSRLTNIRQQITPDLSDGNYYEAFQQFFVKSDEYLGIRAGVNPESIFFNTYVQLAAAIVLGLIIVFFMAYNSGGRVTTTGRTYMDQENTRIVSQRDRYLRKTVTRKRKPSNKNSGGGRSGGGGGISSAGRSHSGSRGSF